MIDSTISMRPNHMNYKMKSKWSRPYNQNLKRRIIILNDSRHKLTWLIKCMPFKLIRSKTMRLRLKSLWKTSIMSDWRIKKSNTWRIKIYDWQTQLRNFKKKISIVIKLNLTQTLKKRSIDSKINLSLTNMTFNNFQTRTKPLNRSYSQVKKNWKRRIKNSRTFQRLSSLRLKE